MAMQPGAPLKWCKPTNPHKSESLGNHKGDFEALNIKNPQPGMHYFWAKKTASSVRRFMRYGFEVVQAEDPEEFGARLPEKVGALLDGATAYSDVVLMRIPLERYRQFRNQRKQLVEAKREASTQAYLAAGKERERELGHRAPRRGPTYHKLVSHETVVSDRLDI